MLLEDVKNSSSIHLYLLKKFNVRQRKVKEESWTKKSLNTDIRP